MPTTCLRGSMGRQRAPRHLCNHPCQRCASARATSTVGLVIVGRDPQVAELTRVLDDAREGRSGSVLLVGDAGMGKSTLLTATERIARKRGFQVVRTSSPEGSVRMRYTVIEDLLDALPEALSQVDPGDAQLLVGLTRSGSVGPGPVASALLRLFSTIQDGEPLLVLVDDLHWAAFGVDRSPHPDGGSASAPAGCRRGGNPPAAHDGCEARQVAAHRRRGARRAGGP